MVPVVVRVSVTVEYGLRNEVENDRGALPSAEAEDMKGLIPGEEMGASEGLGVMEEGPCGAGAGAAAASAASASSVSFISASEQVER
jgi:hypothetical protein